MLSSAFDCYPYARNNGYAEAINLYWIGLPLVAHCTGAGGALVIPDAIIDDSHTARDVILLGEVAERGAEMIEIRCGLCDRHGRLGVARLLAEYGPRRRCGKSWRRRSANARSEKRMTSPGGAASTARTYRGYSSGLGRAEPQPIASRPPLTHSGGRHSSIL
jgi:hypothetical protein